MILRSGTMIIKIDEFLLCNEAGTTMQQPPGLSNLSQKQVTRHKSRQKLSGMVLYESSYSIKALGRYTSVLYDFSYTIPASGRYTTILYDFS
ncbi:hypothetical protein, partial [Paenibacillus fonticola]|uniref:hypothetical protein n=1 Tax=Paenibacillus fonticola TaxID=379896 RepID=UPI0005272576